MIFEYGNPSDVGMLNQKIDYVKKLAPTWIKDEITPAFIGFVARKGKIIFHEAFGKLNAEENSPPVSVDTIFPLCSITKTFTSVAAMILMEDGLLSINRPVQWYIPEFVGENKDQVMVHQLLTHTSGLDDDTVHQYVEEKYKDEQNKDKDYLSLSYDAPLTRKNGEFMSYCSYNMTLIAEIICRISKMSLHDFFDKRIFKPLGMNDTYLVVPKEVWHRTIKFPNDSEAGDWLSSEGAYNSQSAAGGAYSTVKDLAIFGQMLLNKGIYSDTRLLSPVTVSRMVVDRIPGISAAYKNEFFNTASWGLGFNVFADKLDPESGPLQSEKAYGHGGFGRCILAIDPIYETVITLFYVKMPPEFRRPDDLFRNAIISAIIEE
jgi:serine-type D-Ala-D-Ala carboxypeptidase